MRPVLVLILFLSSICTIYSEVVIDALDSTRTPKAIGPYSKGTRINIGDKNMIFASGQIGINPDTGDLVSDDVSAQAKQALANLQNLLEENGSSLKYVTKANIFLTDMNDFAKVNDVYANAFKDSKIFPARSCVAVAALPKNAKVEIELVAFSAKETLEFLN